MVMAAFVFGVMCGGALVVLVARAVAGARPRRPSMDAEGPRLPETFGSTDVARALRRIH